MAGGSSSSVMVPVAVPSWMVALSGSLRSRVKVSLCSSTSSSRVGTAIVTASSPGANVRVAEGCGVVGAFLGGTARGGVVHGHGSTGDGAQGDGELDGLSLLRLGVGDDDGRRLVVVVDGADGGAVLDGRAVGVAEVEGEGLVLLVDLVFEGGHGNRLDVLAGCERQSARSCVVVGAFLGGIARGGVVHGHGSAGDGAQGDGELDRLSLLRLGVGDDDGRRLVVVVDGAGGGAVLDGCAVGVAEVEGEGLVLTRRFRLRG